jgi:iron-sulfur cluster repair protein YtfE (RIC family)
LPPFSWDKRYSSSTGSHRDKHRARLREIRSEIRSQHDAGGRLRDDDRRVERRLEMTAIDTRTSHGHRQDHKELAEHVAHLRLAARELPELSIEERKALVGTIVDFLDGRLVPHATAEEHTLYPAVAELIGREATAPMLYDHRAIRQRLAALEAADPADLAMLQELLYGLHALISVHFWKEEELYFPLLDAHERAGAAIGLDLDNCAPGP